MATFRGGEDWNRAVDRFAAKLRDYFSALGTARNMVSAGYDRVNKRLSEAGEQALENAVRAAMALAEEITFANRLADEQEMAARGSPGAQPPFPRIPQADFVSWTHGLRRFQLAQMQMEFSRILEVCQVLEQTGLDALRKAAAPPAEDEAEERAKGYLQSYLADLRAHADAHWRNPAETGARVRALQEAILGRSVFEYDLE
jgi:hypothetical protein